MTQTRNTAKMQNEGECKEEDLSVFPRLQHICVLLSHLYTLNSR